MWDAVHGSVAPRELPRLTFGFRAGFRLGATSQNRY